MTVSTSFQEYFKNNVISYQVKLYIKDAGVRSSDGLSWDREPGFVDFTSRCEDSGRNLLSKISSISHSTEEKAGIGISYSKMSNIEMSNHDGFFSSPFPTTLKTIYGDIANFNTTKNGKMSNLYNHLVQIRAIIELKDGHIEEGVLGTFVITNIKKSLKSPNVQISLSDLSQPLRKKNSAEKVKDGNGWYTNKSIGFLLEELLRDKYWDKDDTTSGNIPSTFILPDVINIATAGTKTGLSGDNRAISSFGRPPEYDTNWLNKDTITRAILYVPTTSTNLTSGLYCGCDDSNNLEIWRYDASTDSYEQITSGGTAWSLSGYFMWRMWYDTEDDIIVFVTILKSSISDHSSRKATAKFYTYNGTTVTLLNTTPSSITDIFMGDYCVREGTGHDAYRGSLALKARTCGNYTGDNLWYGENIPIPFMQQVNFVNSYSSSGGKMVRYKKTDIFGNVGSYGGAGDYIDVEGGFYAQATALRISSSVPTIGFRFSLGQSGFCVYNQKNKCIVYATITESGSQNTRTYANITIQINKFDINAKSEHEIVSNLYENFEGQDWRCDPLSGCSGGVSNLQTDSIFIGAVAWCDKQGSVGQEGKRSRTYLYKIDASTSVKTKIYDSSSDTNTDIGYAFTPIWMAFNDYASAVYPLKIISFNRTKNDLVDQYSLFSHEIILENSMKTYYGEYNFRRQPTALTFDSNSTMYFVSDGQLYKYYCYGSGENETSIERPIVMDNGWSAVDNELYTACDSLAIDEELRGTGDNAVVYGISSPCPSIYDIIGGTTLGGKYSLWKADNYLSDRIELADFSGMSRWDAIEQLTMLAGLFSGFDVNGNFIILSRDQASSADFTVENTGIISRLIDLDIESNEDDVYNFVQLTPYESTLENPTAEITLVNNSTSENEEIRKGTLVLSQKGTKKKRVQLKCLTDGRLSQLSISFKYRSFGEKFETSLKRVANSAQEYAYIRSGIQDIQRGDSVKIVSELNSEEQTDIMTVYTDPTDPEKEEGKVTFTETLTYNHPINSFVEVNKMYDKWSNTERNIAEDPYFSDWNSDTAPTNLIKYNRTNASVIEKSTTATYEITQHIFIGTLIPIENKPHGPIRLFGKHAALIILPSSMAAGSSEGIYQVIPAQKLKANTIYSVSIYAIISNTFNGEFVDTSFDLQVREGNADISSYSTLPTLSGWTDIEQESTGNKWFKINGTFTTGGDENDTYSPTDITIGLIVNKPSTAASDQGSAVILDGLLVREGISFNDDFVVLTDYDEYKTIGDTDIDIMQQSTNPEFNWSVGDVVIVDCPGLVLKEQTQDVVTALDPVSMSIYGKKEMSDIKNKFVTRRIADQLARVLLEDYKYPKFKIKAKVSITPYLNFVNTDGYLYRVDVKDNKMFPKSGGWNEQCYIQGITHNLSNQTTELTLRAVNYY